MNAYQIIKTNVEGEQNLYQWSVCRRDGKSFDDGVLAINFEYSEDGAAHAIACRARLEKENNNK